VTVQLDNDPPFGVAVDARGHFILPPDRIGSAGPHLGIVTATSVSGRHGMTQVRIE
jgi:hypothetical protein